MAEFLIPVYFSLALETTYRSPTSVYVSTLKTVYLSHFSCFFQVAKRAIGGSQLHQAVSDGNLERVKELLSGSEVNPNKPDVSGWTLAHIATMSATDRDTLKVLVLFGQLLVHSCLPRWTDL